MSTRTVITQAELDLALADASVDTIYIYSSRGIWLKLDNSGSATVEADDSATVEAYGSATVEAYGSATVKAYDSATVKAAGSATVATHTCTYDTTRPCMRCGHTGNHMCRCGHVWAHSYVTGVRSA